MQSIFLHNTDKHFSGHKHKVSNIQHRACRFNGGFEAGDICQGWRREVSES